MAELTDAADLSPLRILLLLQDYGQAHAAQYRRPSDEGNQALGDAARAIYAYTDAREAAARADERAKVAEEIAEALLAVDPIEWALAGQSAGEDAAAIARQHAGNGPRIAVEAPTVHAESHRTSKPAETPSGRASGGVYTGPPIPIGIHSCVTDHPRHSGAQEGER